MTSIRTLHPLRWLGLLLLVPGCPGADDPMETMAETSHADGHDGPTSAVETDDSAGTAGTAGTTDTVGTAGTADTADTAGTTSDDATATEASVDGASSESGSEPEYVMVYQAFCQSCHGDMGQGETTLPNIGPEIRHAHPLMAEYMVRFGDDNSTVNASGAVVGHPGEMTPFLPEVVSDEVLDEIVAWLDSFPQPTTGQELFADYCSSCHGMTGGTDVEYVSAYHNLPFLTSGGTDTLPEFIAYVREGHVVDDMGDPVPPSARREFMPPFGADMLTDEELTLIEAWARQQ